MEEGGGREERKSPRRKTDVDRERADRRGGTVQKRLGLGMYMVTPCSYAAKVAPVNFQPQRKQNLYTLRENAVSPKERLNLGSALVSLDSARRGKEDEGEFPIKGHFHEREVEEVDLPTLLLFRTAAGENREKFFFLRERGDPILRERRNTRLGGL